MIAIRNNGTAVKGVRHMAGLLYLAPGGEAEIEVSEAHARLIAIDRDVEVIPASDPEPAMSRAEIVQGVIAKLDPLEDFTKAGKPEVDAINAALGDDSPHVTAAERDAIWEAMA